MDRDRIEGAAKSFGGKLEATAGEITGGKKIEADGVIDQVVGTAQNALGQAKDAVKDYAGVAGEQLDQAREAAGRAVESGRRYVDETLDRYPESRDMIDRGRGAVQESPILALLIAGAVGYGLALLFHDRSA
jgi:uncharacterized protein YjbJ (UPF0337 family)